MKRWVPSLLAVCACAPCLADEPLQVTCRWHAPGTTPVNSYTLFELDYGQNRFEGANASLLIAGLRAGLNPVLSGVGPPTSEAPSPTAAIQNGLHPQQFYDEGVMYTRDYHLARNSDDIPCDKFDDAQTCHYVTDVTFVIDPCARPLPLIVLFPTGAGEHCFFQSKKTHPLPGIVPNSPLPWETAAPSTFLNGWSAEKEMAQRVRCR